MQKRILASYHLFSLYYRLALLCCISCAACAGKQDEKIPSSPQFAAVQKEVFIDLKAFLQNQDRIKPSQVNVLYDPVFKTKKQYAGYSLSEILDSVMRLHQLDRLNTIVVFVCRDGYQPSMTASEIFAGEKGFLAFKDRSIREGEWLPSVQEKFLPYYLVWENLPKEDNLHVWPFGLTGFRLTTPAAFYRDIYPQQDTKLQAGFALFKSACIKCHSLNKVGGAIGPELNYPRNITTYWKAEDIMAFARNPKAFRYNSAMPAVTSLTDDELKQIVAYIGWMKDKKPSVVQTGNQ